MIGVSPQEVNLDKFLTVEETLIFHAGYYGVPKKKARERAEELLERFGLADKRDQRTNTLSGGHEAAGAVRQGAHARPRRCCFWTSLRRGWTWSCATSCGATSGS